LGAGAFGEDILAKKKHHRHRLGRGGRLAAALVALNLGTAGSAVAACGLALVLAVDVSGSVDPREFRVQMAGLAAALRDPVVSEALVKAQAQVSVVQWTGSSRQFVALPWQKIETFDDIDGFAVRVDDVPRRWRNFSTAIGEALEFSRRYLGQVGQCERLVIDISGDGSSNEGIAPVEVLAGMRRAGIVVNALVIEGTENDLTGYFWENVITGEGSFVVTANDYQQYAAKMRLKLRRETTIQLSSLR